MAPPTRRVTSLCLTGAAKEPGVARAPVGCVGAQASHSAQVSTKASQSLRGGLAGMGSGHASYYLVDGNLAVIGERGPWAQLFAQSHSEKNTGLVLRPS